MSENIQMERCPGLSESCRDFVGKPLTLQFSGWAWTQVFDGQYSDYNFDHLYKTVVEVTPSEFFAQGNTTTRGFRGFIRCEGHPFDQMHIIAGPMVASSASPEESCIFDFTEHLSPEWKFWVSKSEMVLPTKSYRQLTGFDLISGCCVISAKPVPPAK